MNIKSYNCFFDTMHPKRFNPFSLLFKWKEDAPTGTSSLAVIGGVVTCRNPFSSRHPPLGV